MTKRVLSKQQMAGQLRMFMTGPEIQQQYGPHPFEHEEGTASDTELWGRKLSEASREGGPWGGLRSSIQKEGVRTPVQVWHDPLDYSVLNEGHHRVAVSSVDQPERYLPVEHLDERSDLFYDSGRRR